MPALCPLIVLVTPPQRSIFFFVPESGNAHPGQGLWAVRRRLGDDWQVAATFLLIRHAAHDDLDIRLSGRRAGVALRADGRAAAEELGRRLRSEGLTHIACGPLERTLVTAEAIAAACALTAPEPVEALTEIDLGEWTGRAFDSFGDDPAWRAWNEERHRARPPGGESMAEAQARITGWLRATAAARDGGTFAVVTHSDMIRAAVADVLGLALDKLLRFDIDPASITTVVMGDWGAKLVRLNDKGA